MATDAESSRRRIMEGEVLLRQNEAVRDASTDLVVVRAFGTDHVHFLATVVTVFAAVLDFAADFEPGFEPDFDGVLRAS